MGISAAIEACRYIAMLINTGHWSRIRFAGCQHRCLMLNPNTLISKLGFIRSILKTTSLSNLLFRVLNSKFSYFGCVLSSPFWRKNIHTVQSTVFTQLDLLFATNMDQNSSHNSQEQSHHREADPQGQGSCKKKNGDLLQSGMLKLSETVKTTSSIHKIMLVNCDLFLPLICRFADMKR